MSLAPLAPLAAQNRPDVAGMHAAVTSDHPLATAAGADVLRRGGNAVDAAVTMAAVLAVVRPHMNGVGGDAFILVRDAKTGKVSALNGSGRAGSRATPEFFAGRGLKKIPSTGILSVSVPGAVRAWADVLARFGTITLAQALAPAIRYAEEGFPVSEKLARDIAGERGKVEADPVLAAVFLPGGAVPKPGTILREPELAATLKAIAAGGPDVVYKGEVAQKIAAFMEKEGGLLTAADLAKHTSTWTEPIGVEHGGYRILEFPPNSQGATLLEELNIAENFDLKALGWNSAPYIHTLVAIKDRAFADRDRYIADPEFAKVPVDLMLSKEHARELAAQIKQQAADGADGGVDERGSGGAGDRRGGVPHSSTRPLSHSSSPEDGDGDTVYLSAVDEQGNAVSWIQSLFASFGSGRMVPGTGIVLQNRGSLYSLDPKHPNIVAPGKRPYHTLMPGMALRPGGELAFTFGTPGGDGQPQTLLQVLSNLLVFGMMPQSAIEAPRWRGYEDGRLGVEPGIPQDVRDRLQALGHRVFVQDGSAADFGGAQVIWVPAGTHARITGADPRREAYGIAW
ncbi:MAG TPA: gamma-glutamyltransferase [Longimicrobiales bacterium]|nr:gamma-glutamyltransferase [Longimicrobiales bacterium]